MMVKQINTIIGISSKIINFLIIFYVAVLLARISWWVISPSVFDIYVAKSNINAFDNSVKFVVNRAPFGIVVAPPPPPKPTIASEIKITGLYLSSPKDSIVFYQLHDKPYIAKIGDTIGDDTVLKAFSDNGIIVSENNVEVEIDFRTDGGSSISAAPNVIHNSVPNFANSNQSPVAQSADSTTIPPSSTQNNYSNIQGTQSVPQEANLAEKRHKMIEDFMQRRNSESAAIGNGNNP